MLGTCSVTCATCRATQPSKCGTSAGVLCCLHEPGENRSSDGQGPGSPECDGIHSPAFGGGARVVAGVVGAVGGAGTRADRKPYARGLHVLRAISRDQRNVETASA